MWRAFRRSEKNECFKTRELLSGYVDQRLNSEEVAHVEEHLGTCPGCREEMESLRATVALLHRLPEVTPSRSFAVSPVRPLPGRRALPALRFATAGVVLLLLLAFAIDQTNVVERKGQTGSNFGSAAIAEGDEAYWVVQGELNTSVDPSLGASVKLIVPDGSDNVDAAVASLSDDGIVYGTVEPGKDQVPQLVLMEGEGEAVAWGELTQYTVVPVSSDMGSKFAPNDTAIPSDFDPVIRGQEGQYLNILSSDNEVLYSFDLSDSRKEAKAARDNAWLRTLEYGLLGLAAVLGAAAVALWLRQRRARAVEVS